MDPLGIVRELWRHKIYLTIVVVVAAFAAIFSSLKVGPSGLEKRSLQVGAASSQILVDSPGSAARRRGQRRDLRCPLHQGPDLRPVPEQPRGQDEDRQADRDPARDDRHRRALQHGYRPEQLPRPDSEDRANQLVDQGAPNRLVFTAQEGVPIISVDTQAPTADRAAKLAIASFTTLKRYVRKLKSSEEYKATAEIRPQCRGQGRAEGRDRARARNARRRDDRRGQRQDPDDPRLHHRVPAGCAAIVIVPRALGRWRSLEEIEREAVRPGSVGRTAPRTAPRRPLNPVTGPEV